MSGPKQSGRLRGTDRDIISADLIWALFWGLVCATVAARVLSQWTLGAFLVGMIVYIVLIADW